MPQTGDLSVSVRRVQTGVDKPPEMSGAD